MKKLALLAALILLNSCSSSEPAPDAPPLPLPEETASAPASDTTLNSDPFLADQPTPAPASTSEAGSSAAATESEAVDSLLATPVPDSGTVKVNPEPSPESLSAPTPPSISTPPAAAAEPIPAPTLSQNHEVPPTPVMPTAKVDPRRRDIEEEYKEYEQKEASRRELQDAYDERAMFPHEGGNWQLGLDYTRNAFPGRIVNSQTGAFDASSEGGIFSVTYFPMKSLSYGSLGIGPVGSVLWTKYQYTSGANIMERDSSKKRSMYSYGARASYEFHYWLGQLFVPFVLFDFQKVKISAFDRSSVQVLIPAQSFDSKRYGLGLHLNLNRLEPISASRGLANLGIRKTYLSYSFLKEAGGGVADSGTHALGLRFEY